MTRKPTFGRVILRAFVASLIATIIGAELIGIFLAIGLSGTSEHSSSAGLILVMIVGAPLLAAPWVIPSGTIAAMLLAPLALRLAPERTPRALIWLVALGAVTGFILLFLFGFAISQNLTYPQTPLDGAFMLSKIYGPVFGGLTAAGWWWQLPPPIASPAGVTDA